MAKNSNVATAPAADKVHDGEILPAVATVAPPAQRAHRATFATDNLEGGYMVRIEGPHCDKFAKRKDIPVTRFNGEETTVEVKNLVWTGVDKETGKKVALYKMVKNPRQKADAESVAF